MKKMVDCVNWKEYHGLNGWVMFCSAGAYGKKFTEDEAEACGCSAVQRIRCKKVMENNVGFGLVPEIVKEEAIEKKRDDREPAIIS